MVTASERKETLEKELERIVPLLTKRYGAQKIFLFGSLARGKVGPWSDLDLVIIKKTKKRFIERLKEAALLTRADVSIDFLVYTPEEFEEMTSSPRTFQSREILQKAKVLYDRTRTH